MNFLENSMNDKQEIKTILFIICTLGEATCAAPSLIIEELIGILWDEEEAGKLLKLVEDNIK